MKRRAESLSDVEQRHLAVHNLGLFDVVEERTSRHGLAILPIVFGPDLPNAAAAWARAWGLGRKNDATAIKAMTLVTNPSRTKQ